LETETWLKSCVSRAAEGEVEGPMRGKAGCRFILKYLYRFEKSSLRLIGRS
jgi:hypothetical protein